MIDQNGNDVCSQSKEEAAAKASSEAMHPKKKQNKIKPPRPRPVIPVMHVAPDELLLPKPIINVGFPKAGTSTIFSFFHCNGLKSQHWYCCEPQLHPSQTKHRMLMSQCLLDNLIAAKNQTYQEQQQRRPLFQGCGDYDVYTELNGPRIKYGRTLWDDGVVLKPHESVKDKQRIIFPQHHRLDEIHAAYPNATLVLNQRSVAEWIDSVLRWGRIYMPKYILNEFYEQPSTRFLFRDILPVNGSISSNNDQNPKLLEIVHNYHLEYVRSWVARHPSHALVEVDITHEDAGKTLAESFGLNETCWGHYNQNKKNKQK